MLNTAKELVKNEKGLNTVSQAEASDAKKAEQFMESRIKSLIGASGVDIVVSVKVSDFVAAVSGSAENNKGTNGSFKYSVTLTRNEENAVLENQLAVITATAFQTADDNGVDDKPTPSPQNSTDGNTVTAAMSVQTKVNADGRAVATAEASVMNSLIENAKESERNNKNAVIELKIKAPEQATKEQMAIPRESFNSLAKETEADLRISTGIGTLTFDSKAVSTISGSTASGDINVSVQTVNPTTLPTDVQNKVGGRPVYDFTVEVGNTQVSDFNGGSVGVSVPYKLGPDEDPNAVVAYYIDDAGTLQTVRGAYNEKTGMVDFVTSHFSKYAIGYNKVSFADVGKKDWYYNAVTFSAARGITNGTGEGSYSPNGKLTRGQFIVMLMRAYAMAPDKNPTNNFTDAGATYYTEYIAAAKRLGISEGVGGNLFAPEKEITRQEMFTLLYKTLKVIGQLPQGSSGKTLSNYTDEGQVEAWAVEAMNTLVRSGIVAGDEGKLTPEKTATRAEMAQLIYNLFEKQS